jgi:hypothetical protein
MTYPIEKHYPEDFPSGYAPSELTMAIYANSSITTPFLGVKTVGDKVCLMFSSEPPQAEKDEVDSVVTAHQGPTTVPHLRYPPISLEMLNRNVTLDSEFVEVADIVSKVDGFVESLSNTYAVVLGGVTCDATGGDPEYRLLAYPTGSATPVTLVESTSINDTGGVDMPFVVQTDTNLLAGVARYVLEARLNGGTSLVFAGLTATPIELT